MPTWLRILVITVMILSASSFVWFVLGATAYFQRQMDIIGTTYVLFVGIPVLLLTILFMILLIKGWIPISGGHYIMIFMGLLLSLILSIVMIQSVDSQGWTKEKITSDSLNTTVDGKYEYRIDLINVFQRNSNARLYVKNIGSGEVKFIPVKIQTHDIGGLRVSKVNHWIILEPTDKPSRYFLSTTKELGIPGDKFEIDIVTKTSRKLE